MPLSPILSAARGLLLTLAACDELGFAPVIEFVGGAISSRLIGLLIDGGKPVLLRSAGTLEVPAIGAVTVVATPAGESPKRTSAAVLVPPGGAKNNSVPPTLVEGKGLGSVLNTGARTLAGGDEFELSLGAASAIGPGIIALVLGGKLIPPAAVVNGGIEN